MAVIKAHARFIRISPRKARLVVDVIRGKSVLIAENILSNMDKKATESITKLLKSAVANAEHNNSLKKENLYISKIYVNEGPMLKRHRAATMGRAMMIRRRCSHISIELETKESLKIKRATTKGGKK